MWNVQPNETAATMKALVRRFLQSQTPSNTPKWEVRPAFWAASNTLVIVANGDWEFRMANGIAYRGQGSQVLVKGEGSKNDLITFRSLFNRLTDRPQDFAA